LYFLSLYLKEPYDAEECIHKFNGRFFAKRELSCEWYDGITDYFVEESEEIKERRQKAWDAYLERGGE
jgi:HIV Tat-specific factor 1